MYNRSELSKALKEAKAAKSQKKTADINVDIKGNGYKNPKNSNKPALKLYTDSIYNPTDKDLMLYPDNGMAPVFKPAWDTTTTYFPGANSIVEKQMARDGGRFVDKNDPGNNALELHMFYDKDIYQDGGEYLDLTDEEIEQYRKGGYVVEELPMAQTAGTTETPPNPMTYFDTQKPYTDRSGESLRLEKLKQQEDAVIPYYNERTGDFTTQEGTYKPDQYQKVEVSPGVFVARFKNRDNIDVEYSMDNKFNKDNYKHYTRGNQYWPIYSTIPYNETLQQWRAEDAAENAVEQPVITQRKGGYVNNQITHFQTAGTTGPQLTQAQKGKTVKPYLTSDIDDFRSRQAAYKDSLSLYYAYNEFQNALKKSNYNGSDKQMHTLGDLQGKNQGWGELMLPGNPYSRINPIKEYTYYTGQQPWRVWKYKKPVQPVKFVNPSSTASKSNTSKSQNYNKKYPPIYVSDPDDPRIGTYTEAGNEFVYIKPVKTNPKLETLYLPTKKLPQIQTEIIPNNYNYIPQKYEPIQVANRSQTIMEPDPNRKGKFRVKELRQVPYSAYFPGEGWEEMNAPRVMYYNPTTGEETTERYQKGGLTQAQNGIQSQASNAPTDSELTYGEYYAQTADAAKKAYDDYIIALEKEKQRVANVRKNIIPTAKTLDSADNYMLTDDWFNSPEGQAYSNYISAENPKQLEAARQTLTPTVKALLPNQGKYNVARWDANENQWNPRATPSRELYCTPYGCFTYQKAGANDVPIIGGNLDFVQKVNSGSLPFEKIPANQRQPGDMALWVENSPADYTDASKGYIRRPHHTTIYASPDADEPNNPEAGNYYNADNGVRLAYGLTNYETNIEPLDRMDYYRYIGQTKKMQDELIKKQAAWKAAENKADRGPRPTLATVALDRSYFNTERPQEDIIQVDYNQQMIDRINNMDISNKKKRKLLKNAEDVIAFNKTFQQPNSPILETSNVPTVNTQNSQIETFKKGGNMDPGNNALELHMFYDKNNFATGGTVEYLTQDEINQLRAGGITVIEE